MSKEALRSSKVEMIEHSSSLEVSALASLTNGVDCLGLLGALSDFLFSISP